MQHQRRLSPIATLWLQWRSASPGLTRTRCALGRAERILVFQCLLEKKVTFSVLVSGRHTLDMLLERHSVT